MTAAEKRWAVTGLLINAMVWGLSWWPLRQLQAAGFHPLWSTLLVFTPALLVSGVWYRKHWRILLTSPALWALAMAAGATNVGFNWSVTTGDVIRVILLFYTMPAWVVLLAWWLLKETPTAAAFVRLIIAFAGLWLVLWQPGSGWPVPREFADVLALVAGFMFALNNVLLRRGARLPQWRSGVGHVFWRRGTQQRGRLGGVWVGFLACAATYRRAVAADCIGFIDGHHCGQCRPSIRRVAADQRCHIHHHVE